MKWGDFDMEINLKAGDKVVMDRESDFFVNEMMELNDEPLAWWEDLEKIQPLVIESIDEESHNGVLKFENTELMAESVWVKKY